jgi:hypothetical protein
MTPLTSHGMIVIRRPKSMPDKVPFVRVRVDSGLLLDVILGDDDRVVVDNLCRADVENLLKSCRRALKEIEDDD